MLVREFGYCMPVVENLQESAFYIPKGLRSAVYRLLDLRA